MIIAGEATAARSPHSPPRWCPRNSDQFPLGFGAGGENIDWGLVRGFRKQAAEILSNELRDRSVGAERERKIGRARATPTVSHVGVFLDQVAWSLLILKAPTPSLP